VFAMIAAVAEVVTALMELINMRRRQWRKNR
jgi:hypothetical protein